MTSIATTSARAALALACALLLTARAAHAQTDEADRLRDRLRTEASLIVSDLLRLHCPDRCQLLDVRAEVDVGQPLAHVQPGFEELSPQVREVKPRGVEVAVLLDQRLPADFRRDLVNLLKARLKPLPAPASVRADVVPFPQPVLPPMPPSLDQKPQQPLPPPAPEEKKEPAVPTPPPFNALEAFLQRLIDASPWLLAILLIGGTLILVLRALRSPGRSDRDREDDDEDASDAPTPVPPPARTEPPGPPVDQLARRVLDEMRDNPRLRTSVFREMITNGGEEKFARYVYLLGPTIADGLREDPLCRPAIRRIGQTLRAGASEIPEEEARQLLRELDGRITAERLEGGSGTVEEAFDFLDRLSPGQFRKLLESVDARAQGAALRFAPVHLREAALEGMDAARRRGLFLATADGATPDRLELTDIAEELRQHASRLAPGSDPMGLDLLTDLLDSQGEGEQQALLDSLSGRPTVRQALAARLCSETTLLRADENVLASAAGAVEITALVDFLRGTDPQLRERILDASPRPMAGALREELSLQINLPPQRFSAARRQMLRAARTAFEQHGVSIEELNRSTPRRAAS